MFPFILADAAVSAVSSEPAIPVWIQTIVTILGSVVTFVLIPLLQKMKEKNEAEAARHDAEADAARQSGTLTVMETRKLLSERLKDFLIRASTNILLRRLPALATSISTGTFTKGSKEEDIAAVQAELKAWRGELKKEAIVYFEGQGIDLVKEFGDGALDHLIEWAANETAPFPGKETAVALLEDKVSNMVVNFGVDYIRNWSLNRHGAEADPVSGASSGSGSGSGSVSGG